MAKGMKGIQGGNSIAVCLTAGTAVSTAVMLTGAAICAALISSETIGAEYMGHCAMGILLLSAFAGAAVAAGKGTPKRLYMTLLTGAAYMALLFAVTALFFDGMYQGVGVTALIVVCGCILPVLLGQNRGKRTKVPKSKIKRR